MSRTWMRQGAPSAVSGRRVSPGRASQACCLFVGVLLLGPVIGDALTEDSQERPQLASRRDVQQGHEGAA